MHIRYTSGIRRNPIFVFDKLASTYRRGCWLFDKIWHIWYDEYFVFTEFDV